MQCECVEKCLPLWIFKVSIVQQMCRTKRMIAKVAEMPPDEMGVVDPAESADLHAVAAAAAARLTRGLLVVGDAVVPTGEGECARNSFPNSLRCRCYYLLHVLNVLTSSVMLSTVWTSFTVHEILHNCITENLEITATVQTLLTCTVKITVLVSGTFDVFDLL